MPNEHYEKYKDTIKKVARRNYRKRIVLLNEFLADKSCKHCGESETVCLKFYPHDSEIRKITKRVGLNDESRKEIIELIDNSLINYTIKENDHEINVFFDDSTFNLIGWQTKDVYQNLTITFISSIKRNEIFDKGIFKLPIQN